MSSQMDKAGLDVRGAGGELHLVRDLLDNRLVDCRHHPMGRADGLILDIGQGPPELVCIESGITVLAERLGQHAARWTKAALRCCTPRFCQPLRIAWTSVVRIGIETELDLQADQTTALVWEKWLLEHIVRRLPSIKSRDKRHPHPEPSATFSEAPSSDPSPPTHPIRLHEMLGRKVLDVDGRCVGRIEEVRAHVRDGRCLIDRYVLGLDALMQRLSVSDVSLAMLRPLGAIRGLPGREIPWQQMDLTDPQHPRLRGTFGDPSPPSSR